MRTVTLGVGSLEDGLNAFRQAWIISHAEDGARISFTSIDLLWKVMSPKRWALLKTLAGQQPMSVRAAARLAQRDIKAVHGDIQALIMAGIIRRTEEKLIVFPFDNVHVDFMLKAA